MESEDLVNKQTALIASEKGYDLKLEKYLHYTIEDGYFHKPTQLMLKKWLEKFHNLYIEIHLDRTTYPKFCFDIYKYENFGNYEQIKNDNWCLYASEKEALEDALQLAMVKGIK